MQPEFAQNIMNSLPVVKLDSHKLRDEDIHLPVEIWLEVLSHTDTRTIRSISRTCSALRWIAQPLLFKLFVISLPPLPLLPTIRLDRFSFANTRARLSVLRSPHLAYAIEELRIWQPTAQISSPSLSLKEDSCAILTSPQVNDLTTAIFTAIPSLKNLRRLVFHDVLFTSERLKALACLSRLTDLELHSCWTTCPSTSFPNFSEIPLETLTFDYSYYPTSFFPNPPFLFISLLLQPATLKHVSTGPTSEIINAIDTLPTALPNLTRLEIPLSSLSSPLLLSALTSCPAVTELILRTPPGHISLPPVTVDLLPAKILPLLNTYRGPRMYGPVFVHGRTLSCIDFTFSCQPDDLISTIRSFDLDPSCTAHTRTFSCKVQHLNAETFQAIHTAFPALTNLAISGAAVDIHALSSMLFNAEEAGHIKTRKDGLKSIQLYVKMGLPRPTLRWRTIGARMFLERLVEAYPNLQTARLVCQPDQAVLWQRPPEMHVIGCLEFESEQLWVEKQEGGGGGCWETVKRKW